MLHRGGCLDDSFTSITSVSTNSSLEGLEEVKEKDHERELNMGQKNTHEMKSKRGKSKHAPSAKDDSGGSLDSPQAGTNDNNTDGKFFEVLDSDEENSHAVQERNQTDALIISVKNKLGPLLADTSSEEELGRQRNTRSQETSSEDDYDQPEGIEGISRKSKKMEALRNWRRILSKQRSILLLETEEGDDGSIDIREENNISQNEEDIDSSTADHTQRKAVENWKSLVSKMTDRKLSNETSLRAALIGHIDAAEISSDKEDESRPGDEGYPRVLENWKKILTKVLKNIGEQTMYNLKGLVEEMKSVESRKDIAFMNWKRIVTKVIKQSRRHNLTNIIKSNLEEQGESNDSDVNEMNITPAIKNWENLVLKVMHRNTEGDIRKLLLASINFRSLKDDENAISSKESTDDDEQRPSFRNWRRIISKLIYENRSIDIGAIFERKRETNDGLSKTDSEINDDSSTERKTDNERAIRNWKEMVSNIIEKSEGNFTNELLESKLKEVKMPDKYSDESDSELLEHLGKWERLVSGILKNSRIRELQTVLVRAEERESRSSEGESDVSETPSRKESIRRIKAIKNWCRMTKKLIEKNREITFKHVIKEQLRNVEDGERRTSRKDDGLRAVENWKRIVHKMMIHEQAIVSLIPKVAEEQEIISQRHEELQTSPSAESDTLLKNRQLRAMKNWKNLSMKVRVITSVEHDMNGNDMEDICPSCNNEYICPILLSCSHTFCRDCVTQFIDDSEGECFECPTCEAKNTLSENDEELFCPNFIFLRQMQQKKSGDDGCRYCGRGKTAEFICEQCADKYCKDCAPKHTKQTIFENHSVVDLQSLENVGKLRKKYYCFKHVKEELTQYCLTCEISLCGKCAKKKHRGSKHDCGSVSTAAIAGREMLEDATRMLEGETNFDSDFANIKKMQSGLDVELNEVTNEIKSRIDYLIGKLRERETQLCMELERRYEIIQDALSQRKDDVYLASRQTEDFRFLLRDLKVHENDVEMLQMQATVGERMKDLIELKRENGLFIDYDFVFHPGGEEIESAIDNYGFVSVQDRESKQEIIVEGYEDRTEHPAVKKAEENLQMAGENLSIAEDKHKNSLSEDDGYDQPRESWSPTAQKRDPRIRKRPKQRGKHVSDSDDGEKTKNEHHVSRGKRLGIKSSTEDAGGGALPESPQKQRSKTDSKHSYEEIKPQIFEFEGFRQPAYEGFTQLTSERGEHVNILKYGVRNYKNESCDVMLKMTCPDKSILSAHVAENTDGTFTVFFCPKVKSDYNCFINISGNGFKKEYKLLNFYGDFQGMSSKEIDLACRAMSLLRWHITPGLLENKHGKIKRSRKFMKIIGTQN